MIPRFDRPVFGYFTLRGQPNACGNSQTSKCVLMTAWGQIRPSDDVRCTTALAPKPEVDPRPCYVANVPDCRTSLDERVERRLMAILAADVAGYSRLVSADEEGTLAQWKANWRELIDRKIKEHGGRIVRITGDGLLVEFASVIAAVRCAVEVQRAMVKRNTDVPQEKRIEF